MTAVMMPGGPVADAVFADLVPRIEKLKENGHTPGLATVLVGGDDASARYVGMKMQKADELGCNSPHAHLSQDATTEDVMAVVREFNDDDAVDAMLVQYPAPPQVDFDAVLMAINPDKDVDGIHPTNMGRMALGVPGPVSCTPAGIEALLAFGLMSLSLAKFRIDVILPALLLIAGAIAWARSSGKHAITAGTLVTLVGALQLAAALHVLS